MQLIQYYLFSLWSRRWIIVGIAWLGCLGGWSVVAMLPDRYESTARIYVDTQSLLTPLMQGLAVQQNREREVDIVRRTLLSRPNIEQLARTTDLLLTVDSQAEIERIYRELANQIRIVTQGPGLFRVTFDHNDPRTAQRVVSTVISLFVEQNIGGNSRDLEESLRFVEAQLADYERQLGESDRRIGDYRRDNAELLGGQRETLVRLRNAEANLQRLRLELQTATWRRDQLERELAATPQTLTELATSTAAAEPDMLSQMRRELAQLRATLTDRHPNVVALQRQIEAMERAPRPATIARSRGREQPNPAFLAARAQLERLQLDIQQIEMMIESNQRQVQELDATYEGVPEVEAALAQLQRDRSILERNYELLIQRRESARLAQRIQTETTSVQFRVVEPPSLPLTPSSPNRRLLFAGVLVAALGAGVGIALLRSFFAQVYISVQQIRESFEFPVLGGISEFRTRQRRRAKMIEVSVLAGLAGALIVVDAILIASPQIGSNVAQLLGAGGAGSFSF